MAGDPVRQATVAFILFALAVLTDCKGRNTFVHDVRHVDGGLEIERCKLSDEYACQWERTR
jgi:hypothetical protein